MSIRESLLAKRPPKLEKVSTAVGDVYLRVMNGIERDHYEMVTWRGQNASEENLRAKLLVKCICDEKGERQFADEDHLKLGAIDSTILVPLYIAALRLNKLRVSDIEETVKNSESAPGGATT